MATVRGTVLLTANPKPWFAKYASGESVGSDTQANGLFSNLGAAKKRIEQSAGGRALNWVREDVSGMESYTGYDPNF